jgi:hypothetical protein
MSKVHVIPYAEVNGTRTIPDNLVAGVFEKFKTDGMLHVVFCDGGIKTADEFIAMVKNNANAVSFLFYNEVISGIAWLNNISVNHGMAHFCLFKEVWGGPSIEIGHEVFRYWFSMPKPDGTPLFDVITGMLPATHKHAIRFIQKLGCTIVGEIPKMMKNVYTGEMAPAVISYKERD